MPAFAQHQPLTGRTYAVVTDHGKLGRQLVGDPEWTTGSLAYDIATGQIDRVISVHVLEDGIYSDVTDIIRSAVEQIQQEREAA